VHSLSPCFGATGLCYTAKSPIRHGKKPGLVLLWLCANMARAARNGKLSGWLADTQGYYLRSTMYSFLIAVGSIDILRSRLTTLDFSLDKKKERQFALGKAITRAFNRHIDFASAAPSLDYDPDGGAG